MLMQQTNENRDTSCSTNATIEAYFIPQNKFASHDHDIDFRLVIHICVTTCVKLRTCRRKNICNFVI